MSSSIAKIQTKVPMKKISQFLTTPSNVARTLDWREASGSILSLDITRASMGLALASHPSQDQEMVTDLNPINVTYEQDGNRKFLSKQTLEELQSTISRNNVCALVINWPIDKHNDRIGAPCGKVLHTLDFIIESTTLLDKKPFCLYSRTTDDDSTDYEEESFEEDNWGRAKLWSRPCPNPEQKLYVASKEQYNYREHSFNNDIAIQVIDDFLHEQWPDFFKVSCRSKTRRLGRLPQTTKSVGEQNYATSKNNVINEQKTSVQKEFSRDSDWLGDCESRRCASYSLL